MKETKIKFFDGELEFEGKIKDTIIVKNSTAYLVQCYDSTAKIVEPTQIMTILA